MTTGTFPSGAVGGGRLAARHGLGMNVIWADYHAKWVKNPPEDCSAWTPLMQPGEKKISTSYSDNGCRPGQNRAVKTTAWSTDVRLTESLYTAKS